MKYYINILSNYCQLNRLVASLWYTTQIVIQDYNKSGYYAVPAGTTTIQ